MKIAYLISHNISRNDGVTKKIKGQIDEWQKLGCKVKVFAIVPHAADSILDAQKYLLGNYLSSRLTKINKLLADMEDFGPDCVYFRYDTWSMTLSHILKKYKSIAELNTYDLGEFYLLMKKEKTVKSALRYFVYKLLRGAILSKVAGIVGVTKEIAEHPSVLRYKKKCVVIPNAIDLSKFEIIKTGIKGNRIGLFFIGTPNQPWHGVDIIEFLSQHMPQYDFHIVGINGKNGNNLFWHGYLCKKDYISILKKCHICIGSLAIYRNQMFEACPLKVREYLALGYPVIIGYEDTAFLHVKNKIDFIYKIDPQNINVSDVQIFIEKMYAKVVTASEVEKYISASVIEKQRVSFFVDVVNDSISKK